MCVALLIVITESGDPLRIVKKYLGSRCVLYSRWNKHRVPRAQALHLEEGNYSSEWWMLAKEDQKNNDRVHREPGLHLAAQDFSVKYRYVRLIFCFWDIINVYWKKLGISTFYFLKYQLRFLLSLTHIFLESILSLFLLYNYYVSPWEKRIFNHKVNRMAHSPEDSFSSHYWNHPMGSWTQ